MAEDEMSLLEEYSIAEMQGDLDQWGDLEDAFCRYAKVIFHDVADSYATDADVLCSFTLSPEMTRQEGDIVALFRLGWRHLDEMITSQLVPEASNPESREYEVLFKAKDLPKTEGEIYQLCYISSSNTWGASVPFEFRRVSAEELTVVDSGDIAVVRSQPAIAEDLKRQLAELRKEITQVKSNNLNMQVQLNESEANRKELQKRLDDLEKVEEVLDRLRGENRALDKAHNEAEEALKHAELRIMSLEKTVEALQEDIIHSREQLTLQIESRDWKNCNLEIIDALRQGKDVAVREMRTAMAENERLRSELALVTTEKEKLLQMLSDVNKTLEKRNKEKEYCEAMMLKDRKEASERIEGLLAELTRITSGTHLSSDSSETEVIKSQISALETKLEGTEWKEHKTIRGKQNAEMVLHDSQVQNEGETENIQAEYCCMTASQQEVMDKIESLHLEIAETIQTENSLCESHSRLTSRVENLQKIMNEAELFDNNPEADLHRRELAVATAKLEEKLICILSARNRKDDLKLQLEDLKQLSAALNLEKTQAKEALRPACDVPSNENGDSSSSSNQVDRRKEFPRTESTNLGENLSEVAELRERLKQAAEAYKILYQQKVLAERKLQRMQELERHSANGKQP